MPFIKVFLHFVWTTKNQNPILVNKNTRERLWQHIRENAVRKNIQILEIGGHINHCHCLISLNKDQAICQVVQLLKGESSYWMNKSGLISQHFEWQEDYYVEAIPSEAIPNVINYIQLQEEHHRNQTFQEEVKQFLVEYHRYVHFK